MSRPLRSNFEFGTVREAARRAQWKALGLGDEDFEKPKIAVVNSSSELAICFRHLDGVAAVVKEAIWAAGGLPFEIRTTAPSDFIVSAGGRGGYILADAGGGTPEVILIATGSDVALAIAAHEELSGEGIRSRVVSLPCWELFDRQDQSYRDEVLSSVACGAERSSSLPHRAAVSTRKLAGRADTPSARATTAI